MSIWKTPDQKPDVFKPHTIMVVYEAHDELYELADMVIVSCGVMRFDYAKGFNCLSVTLGTLY